MAVNYVQASGRDIADLVEKIEDAVEGSPNIAVAAACIVVAALSQNPDIAPARLQYIVKAVSELMATTLFIEEEVGESN